MRFILSLRLYSSFITSRPVLVSVHWTGIFIHSSVYTFRYPKVGLYSVNLASMLFLIVCSVYLYVYVKASNWVFAKALRNCVLCLALSRSTKNLHGRKFKFCKIVNLTNSNLKAHNTLTTN